MLKAVITNDTITKRLEEMKRKSNNGSEELFKQIADDMHNDIIRNFEREQDPNGKRWRPLKPDTLALPPKDKLLRATKRKKLQNTGRLKKSIEPSYTANSASVGTSSNYAMAHQYGSSHEIRANNAKYLKFYTTKGWQFRKAVFVNIPARPFIGITKRRYKRYLKRIMDFFIEWKGVTKWKK